MHLLLIEPSTDVTRAKLTLPPVTSLFPVAARPHPSFSRKPKACALAPRRKSTATHSADGPEVAHRAHAFGLRLNESIGSTAGGAQPARRQGLGPRGHRLPVCAGEA